MFYHACLNNYDNKDLLAIRGTNDLVTTVTAAGPAEVNEPSVEATLIPNISSNPVSTTDVRLNEAHQLLSLTQLILEGFR